MINIGVSIRKKEKKNRKTILREEKQKKKKVEVRKTAKEGRLLREVTMKIGLESINMQEGIMVEALLDSRATGLVMSSEFVRKQGFKKIKRPIYIRNMNEMFNKEKPMEHTVKVNIYYQRHRKKTKINVIRDQK